MIPNEINGNPVRHFAELESPAFPIGYPEDGNLERTKKFVISISDENDQEERRYWVSCIGVSGKVMTGDIFYTLYSAKELPKTEFGVSNLKWKEYVSKSRI